MMEQNELGCFELSDSDTELMMRVRDGDRDAFNQLYQRYETRLRALFMSFPCSYDETQDLIQETFLRLWLARGSYQTTGPFTAYLFTIARNCWLGQLRKRKCRPQEISSNYDDEPMQHLLPAVEQMESSDSIPEESLMLEYRNWRIRQAVQLIPEPYRTAFVLVHLRGMKYAEVAEKMAIPIGTVKSRINTALGILRERLKEELL